MADRMSIRTVKRIMIGYFVVWFCIIVAIAVACDTAAEQATKASHDGKNWSLVQSPLTGRCYEVLAWQIDTGNSSKGFAGMAEIPCSVMEERR